MTRTSPAGRADTTDSAADTGALHVPIGLLRTTNPARTSYMRYRASQSTGDAPDVRTTDVRRSDTRTSDVRKPDVHQPDVREPGVRTDWTALGTISPLLVCAVVHAEDPRFFAHHGVDVAALARKIVAAARGRMGVVGASTLTQQLARNLYLTPTRSLPRKVRELALAIRLDATLPKPRILELYLNVIEWGVDVWGCRAASQTHIGKGPGALDLFESTFLASLIAAPRSPLSGRNAARSRYVQLRVTYQLLLAGVVSAADCSGVARRVREMHARLAAGAPLAEAMATPPALTDVGEVESLEAVCRALHVRPLVAARAVAGQCGCAQERRAWHALRARVGQDVMVEAVVTGNHERIRAAFNR